MTLSRRDFLHASAQALSAAALLGLPIVIRPHQAISFFTAYNTDDCSLHTLPEAAVFSLHRTPLVTSYQSEVSASSLAATMRGVTIGSAPLPRTVLNRLLSFKAGRSTK